MLDAIGAGLAPRVGDRDWADIWRDSPEYKVMRQEIENIKQQGLALPVPEKSHETTCEYELYSEKLYLAHSSSRCYILLGPAQGGREAQ